jgi:hypothetical protein
MRKKLIAALFVTAVAGLPAVARADWNTLKERGTQLEPEGKSDVNRGERLYDEGKTDYNKGTTVEKKTVTTYHKLRGHHGQNVAKTTTTTKVKKE